ncbi:adenylate kinase family protein [Candidatus Hepatobacter penaei]|uniref:adenylate kinase family protein n=1 Tax=Candidatus Hepatobacter penaei TaxID=1274402 RepID=UPI0009E5263B|nr:nucleoside monophosphate kinase [Candidatus Hepatobacter penaei]
MRIVLLGLPGSGKGTQARILAEKLSLPLVGTGDLLRREIENQTPLGQQLKPIMDRGDFPPDALVMDVFMENVKALPGFVVEGIPRSRVQVDLLDKAFAEHDMALDFLFYLDLPQEVALNRLLSRYMCLSCGATYGPKDGKKRVCDFCGGTQFGQRRDDVEDVIVKRLKAQHLRDQDILKAYEDQPFFHRISAQAPADEVSQKIVDCLKNSPCGGF